MDSDNPPPQLRNNKIRGDEQSFHVLLPQEIIEEILAKLPVKSILRFKCVSKSWRSLIESERFIKIHMQSSRDDKTYAHWRVIFNCLEASGVFCLKQCSRRSLEDETPIDLSPIEDPTNNNQPISGNIVDCCNGMLCIIKKRRFFMLFNPATRIFHSLPVIDTAGIHIHGFGWDETSNAYKVFASMLDKDNHTIGRVYSTKTDSWKTIEHEVPHSRVYENGKFACGKTHWLVKSGHGTQIEYFNLKSEAFGLIELPFKPEVNSWLVETNGCLGVSRYNDETRLYDVWVMKEYGVKESWVKESWLVTRTNITRFHGWHSYYETLVSPIVALTGPEIKC